MQLPFLANNGLWFSHVHWDVFLNCCIIWDSLDCKNGEDTRWVWATYFGSVPLVRFWKAKIKLIWRMIIYFLPSVFQFLKILLYQWKNCHDSALFDHVLNILSTHCMSIILQIVVRYCTSMTCVQNTLILKGTIPTAILQGCLKLLNHCAIISIRSSSQQSETETNHCWNIGVHFYVGLYTLLNLKEI